MTARTRRGVPVPSCPMGCTCLKHSSSGSRQAEVWERRKSDPDVMQAYQDAMSSAAANAWERRRNDPDAMKSYQETMSAAAKKGWVTRRNEHGGKRP